MFAKVCFGGLIKARDDMQKKKDKIFMRGEAKNEMKKIWNFLSTFSFLLALIYSIIHWGNHSFIMMRLLRVFLDHINARKVGKESILKSFKRIKKEDAKSEKTLGSVPASILTTVRISQSEILRELSVLTSIMQRSWYHNQKFYDRFGQRFRLQSMFQHFSDLHFNCAFHFHSFLFLFFTTLLQILTTHSIIPFLLLLTCSSFLRVKNNIMIPQLISQLINAK